MLRKHDFRLARPWLLITGVTMLIILMGFAYCHALQRVRMEQFCIKVADRQVVSLYWNADISEYQPHQSCE